MDSQYSPDTESFSTPPSSPFTVVPSHQHQNLAAVAAVNSAAANSASSSEGAHANVPRRRPSTLQLPNEGTWNGDVVLQQSPEAKSANQTPVNSILQRSHLRPENHQLKPPLSPCFVHSHLDNGVSLNDWLRQTRSQLPEESSSIAPSMSMDSSQSSYDEDEEDEYSSSLTRQLAETAVGVREMSKQLGRARVRSNVQNILIITKARDNRLIKLTRELALYLMTKPRDTGRGLTVYVDAQLRHSKRFDAEGIKRDYPELFRPSPKRRSSNSSVASAASESGSTNLNNVDEGQLRYWTSDMCSRSPHLFDFVVTLGGDGTVLFTSWLFQRIVPPVLPFALGSLGFLTNFDFDDNQAVMDSAIDNGIRVNLRMRFTCTVYRAVKVEQGKGRKAVKKGETGEIMMKNIEKGGWEALESDSFANTSASTSSKDKEIMCFTTRPAESFEILNDLVVDRGPSPYVSLLELFGDEHHMTTVQADGLCVSTPTGSTAYSLSAGGSLVHPEIPALLITPICPHTLSFRPMLLPDTMELRICVPFNSRSTAWASFDGRGRVELKQGDHIKVVASKYPFPTVCADKQSTDWFHAIARTLKWNERERQKSFVVVEEEGGPDKPQKKHKHHHHPISPSHLVHPVVAEDDEDEEDEEEEDEGYDIDDSSPEAAAAKAAAEKANASSGNSANNSPPAVDNTNATGVSSRSSTNGIDSPNRFAGLVPHVPAKKHVTIAQDSSPSSNGSGSDTPNVPSVVHKTLRDVGLGFTEEVKTPRPGEAHVHSQQSKVQMPPKPHHHHHHHSQSNSHTHGQSNSHTHGQSNSHTHGQGNAHAHTAHQMHQYDRHHHQARSIDAGRRAFAVLGHDESDSNTSSGE